jgi:hypothetical protein
MAPKMGGVDGYFIDKEARVIHILQSKFRTTERNFEGKNILPEEILAMDVDRIARGHKSNAEGIEYNGKVQGLIRKISEIEDIARYDYTVVIIANCALTNESVKRLTGGFAGKVFDFAEAYDKLVFPVVSGTFFKARDITIQLDLSNKSAGAKTSYAVSTPAYECEITVLFVPTLEIAKTMDRFRNSILESNPRSYLDLDGQAVNASIRETLLRPDSNEFALMNNGLTILSDETNLSERVGQHNKAQIRLLNPQIINGGQTAYTLSRIYNQDKQNAEINFAGKEVLTKVITLTKKETTLDSLAERGRLIEEISAATNRQTAVISTDKFANDDVQLKLQRLLFDKFGILYERKRGEFSDGVFSGYIDRSQILDRALFLRILLALSGQMARATRRRVFAVHGLSDEQLLDSAALDRFWLAYGYFLKMAPRNTNAPKKYRDVLAKVIMAVSMHRVGVTGDILTSVDRAWSALLRAVSKEGGRYSSVFIERETGNARLAFSPDKWMNSADFQRDVIAFVSEQERFDKPWAEFANEPSSLPSVDSSPPVRGAIGDSSAFGSSESPKIS